MGGVIEVKHSSGHLCCIFFMGTGHTLCPVSPIPSLRSILVGLRSTKMLCKRYGREWRGPSPSSFLRHFALELDCLEIFVTFLRRASQHSMRLLPPPRF